MSYITSLSSVSCIVSLSNASCIYLKFEAYTSCITALSSQSDDNDFILSGFFYCITSLYYQLNHKLNCQCWINISYSYITSFCCATSFSSTSCIPSLRLTSYTTSLRFPSCTTSFTLTSCITSYCIVEVILKDPDPIWVFLLHCSYVP